LVTLGIFVFVVVFGGIKLEHDSESARQFSEKFVLEQRAEARGLLNRCDLTPENTLSASRRKSNTTEPNCRRITKRR